MLNKELIKLACKIYWQEKKNQWVQKLPFKKKYKDSYGFRNYFIQMKNSGQFKEMAFKHFFGYHAFGVTFQTANGTFISDPGDIEINNSLGNQGKYDIDKINDLLTLVNNTSVIYILGTHIGTLLVPLAKRSGKVFGFEANPHTFTFIEHNLLLNCIHNATVYHLGVYDTFGYLPFYQNKANSGGSKIKPVKDDFVYTYDDPAVHMVETVCLDEFHLLKKIPLPDLMIVDIEGAEYPALKKACKCLDHCKYLYIEFVPHHIRNVANIDLSTFLSVILPYFNKMKVAGSDDRLFEGEEISHLLKEFYTNETCVDLLFMK